MIKYFVRTTDERQLDSSYSQIEYELLIDTEHNCGKAFLKQLEYVNDYDAVLLEDDCVLCKDFKKRIEEVISKHPNDIINFFTLPYEWRREGYTLPRKFCYNQCTYFPKGISKQIVDAFLKTNTETNSAERIMKVALKKLKLNHYVYIPFLVQHLDNDSIMNHKKFYKRRSPFFIDYLDELGITYEEARTGENKNKLIRLLQEKFKEIDNK